MRSLRVAMLLENNPYPQDIRVRHEAEALARAGHRVTVVAPRAKDQPRTEVVAGVRVRRFPLPATPDTVLGFVVEYALAHLQLYARGILELLRGAEALHLNNPPDTLFVPALVARALGRRVVYDLHDLFPELFEEKFGSSPVVTVLRWAQRASIRTAHVVLATNDSQADLAREHKPDPDRVVTVRNGPPQSTLTTGAEPREGSLTQPRLVYLGSLGAQDGVDDLVPLLVELRERHALAPTLTVIGDGPRRTAIACDAAAHGLSEAVELTGWIPYSEIPNRLAAADICVDPAGCSPLNHRSTMIKVAEYLAAARPVVAYRLLETTRTAAEAALYADCGDRRGFADLVAKVAKDESLRDNLSARAERRAPELVWERSEHELLAAYNRL